MILDQPAGGATTRPAPESPEYREVPRRCAKMTGLCALVITAAR
jgi:hypothetical protein